MLIGRTDRNKGIIADIDLSAIDLSVTVSRVHAELQRSTKGWLLVDRNSMNGTYINGKKLKPDLPVPIQRGDRCRFGSVSFEFVTREGSNFKLRQCKSAVRHGKIPDR